MNRRLMFKPSFHVEVVEPEGAFLLAEREHFVLKGKLACQLAPLLNGQYTADEIVDRVTGDTDPAKIYYSLRWLEDKGYVVADVPDVSVERAVLWHALDLEPLATESLLNERGVSLAGFGNVPIESFSSTLTSLNARIVESGEFTIVLADDYLREGLADFNNSALLSGRPWLLMKPVGTVAWIGPIFRPGQTACWECLAHRLRANRIVESYLEFKKGKGVTLLNSGLRPRMMTELVLMIEAFEAAKAVGGSHHHLDNAIITLDLLTLETKKHTLTRRPQCVRCGDPGYQRKHATVPITLKTSRKRFTTDGGHRIVSPEQTLASYAQHISPITGAVNQLERISADKNGVVNVYVAGHNLRLQKWTGSPSVNSRRFEQVKESTGLDFLREVLRDKSAGKGVSDSQARASGLCEALERYSGVFQGDESIRKATYKELGAAAIHPNVCMLYSEEQYRNWQRWTDPSSGFQFVPQPLDQDARVDWTPVWSLSEKTFKYLPTGYCYYGYPDMDYYFTDSNGNAAGNTLEEAILQGFLELVERDSVALWWYNRLKRPGVDLSSFSEPWIENICAVQQTLNRELWVLDLTSDLGIPAFAAISRRVGEAAEKIMFGFGAHLDPRIGVLRALTEVQQSAAFLREFDNTPSKPLSSEVRGWTNTATVKDHPYLLPDTMPARVRSDFKFALSDDLFDDVRCCQEAVERLGLEMLVLDQTRPDIGLPVVKVIVPGLRHFWARLATGRLYEVPVKLGWLKRPLTEEQLNPIPFERIEYENALEELLGQKER